MNDNNIGVRSATVADDGDNGSNGKENRFNDDDGGGGNWGDVDVDVDNGGGGIASLFPCILPIIVESDGDRKGGKAPVEEEEEQASFPGIAKATTNQT